MPSTSCWMSFPEIVLKSVLKLKAPKAANGSFRELLPPESFSSLCAQYRIPLPNCPLSPAPGFLTVSSGPVSHPFPSLISEEQLWRQRASSGQVVLQDVRTDSPADSESLSSCSCFPTLKTRVATTLFLSQFLYSLHLVLPHNPVSQASESCSLFP